MFDVAGYSVGSWLMSLVFVTMGAIPVAIVLVGIEWVFRRPPANPRARIQRGEYHRGNLWLGEHWIVLAVVSYGVVLTVLFLVYQDRVCANGGSGDFCF